MRILIIITVLTLLSGCSYISGGYKATKNFFGSRIQFSKPENKFLTEKWVPQANEESIYESGIYNGGNMYSTAPKPNQYRFMARTPEEQYYVQQYSKNYP